MHQHILGGGIFARMKPHELVAALMRAQGLGAYPLARRLKKPGLQSQIHRFINGQVAAPARSTAEPLARFFELPVDAIYDEKVATRIARERNVQEQQSSAPPSGPARTRQRAEEPPAAYSVEPALAQALAVLGRALESDMAPELRRDIAEGLARLAERRGGQPHQKALLAYFEAGRGKRRNVGT
jgi:hypothetical protein